MLENRHIHLFIILLVIAASIFTLILTISPETLGIISTSEDRTEYEKYLFKENEISEINIEIDEDDWNWLLENATEEEYRSANITINGETFYNVGIRPKGNSTLKTVAQSNDTNRYSFKIKFDEYVKGQTYHGLDKLVLNANINDATNMKEYISYELFEKMDIPTPLHSFSNISVNGEGWGLYLAVEDVGESFLIRNFGVDYGNLYKPDEGSSLKWIDENHESYQSIKSGAITKVSDEEFDRVVEMIENLNNGTNLEKCLNIDEILKYFAVNTILVNQDSYVGNFNHNYLLYEENGVFSILPWDLDLSFGGFQTRSAKDAINLSIDKPYSGNAENYPLLTKLLEVDEYKEKYHKYMEEAVQLYFDSGLFEETIDKTANLIDEYVKNDQTSVYTYEEYTKSLSVLKEFGKLRAKSVIAQLNGQSGVEVSDLDLSALGGMMGGGVMGRPGGNMPGNGNNKNPMMPPDDERNNMNSSPPSPDNRPNGVSPEKMEQIMAIIRENDGEELTEEQVNKLKDLGFTSEEIENIKKMPAFGNKDNNELGGRPNSSNNPTENRRPGNMGRNENIAFYFKYIGISILAMIVSLLIVYKFKRRKYST